jgi:L-rhamnose-H+ transport protein
MNTSTAALGALLALLSGVLNGVSMLPMRYLGKWEWENVWLLYILFACVLMPVTMVVFTVHDPIQLLALAPLGAMLGAVVGGGLWGLGAILFGQAVSATGISLTNTIVMAISSSMGSLLPLLILHPASLSGLHGRMIVAGTAVAIVGMVFSGVAGHRREQNRRQMNCEGKEGEGELVGKRRPFHIGILLCIGAGILSAVFNIGFSLAQPMIVSAESGGYSASDATNFIWLLMLGMGAMANAAYCVYLLVKNGSVRKFLLPGGSRLYLLTSAMGLTWGGSMFVYGEATNRLGPLGTVVGWPLFLTTALLVGNLCGVIAGEWRATTRATRCWMGIGMVTLIVAILVLGKAGTL